MTLRLELGGISKDDKQNIYTVQVRAIRDEDDKLVGAKDFEAKTAPDLKSKVKPVFQSLVDSEKNRENIRSVAQAVIDEIMTEVVQ